MTAVESYKDTVLERLKRLSNVILEKAMPFAVYSAVEQACSVIQQKLRAFYRSAALHAVIALALNAIGIFLALLEPFGGVALNYAAATCFVAAFAWGAIRIIRDIRRYGRPAVCVSKSIWRKRSVSRGIEDYVFSEFSEIAIMYAGIEVASNYCPSLKEMPRFNELVRFIIRAFWKQLALFGGIAAAYLILIYGVAKPFILSDVLGVHWYEPYFYPVFHVVSIFAPQ